MKREKIKIDINFIKELISDDLEGYDVVYDNRLSYENDDSNDYEFIVKRLSDDKFFQGTYNMWFYDKHIEDYSNNIEEVFPEPTTIIVYK